MAGNLGATHFTSAPQKSGGMPLMDALAKRSTARAFATNELPPQQISSLLWSLSASTGPMANAPRPPPAIVRKPMFMCC